MHPRANPNKNPPLRVPDIQIERPAMQEQIGQIRDIIESATERQGETASLVECLALRAPQLHNAISLPADSAPLLLADFVVRYIEHVPDFIEAIYEIACDAGLIKEVQPLLSIATDYFLKPPDLLAEHSPLESLLDEAYLAHRLLEEINDRFIQHCGQPLVPMDTTRANLIAHELIGEPFANELDQAVLFSAELLLSEYSFTGAAFEHFFERHKKNGWSVELSRWPCLAADRAIFLNFDTRRR
ncbi:hypothetical protein QWI17_17980 [Gilvimarinus sp. SDUM040013]|uniref:Uncharacterized protein n=1 Tax=Gilvimarinus gilvus TaxID=3058038 RepID=A0ABU4RVD0_9GAMM|nr:hypothetical protein [Gilvimarinus sp. SDUM040013]MDO3387738.1 hypothetical protein [Gilvimarinus sp. SDUM040013]MDX6848821.1 hypothetical protein [Gilvimarinus sp. SDUM040013]